MKKIGLLLFLCLLCVGCDVLSFGESPEKLLEESVQEMAGLTSYTAHSDTTMKSDVFGSMVDYRLQQKIEVNRKDKIKMMITDKKQGTKMFLSETGMATYENGDWATRRFGNSQRDAEDKWLIQQFLSLQDPKSTWNTLGDSQVKKTVSKKGEESIHGVNCTVIEMKMEAKEFMKVYGNILGSASGIKGSSGIFENVGNMMVEHTTYTYWIGEKDKKIHRGVLLVDTKIGTYKQDVTYDGFNEPWNPSYPK